MSLGANHNFCLQTVNFWSSQRREFRNVTVKSYLKSTVKPAIINVFLTQALFMQPPVQNLLFPHSPSKS